MIQFLHKHRHRLLVMSFGIIYIWFGMLKFFPGLSPAEDLAKQTIHKLTFGLIPDHISIILLAIWEVSIGVLMLVNRATKWVVYITLFHLVLTFTPLFLLPASVFDNTHTYSLTLVGQYIIKNLVLIAALLFMLPERRKEDSGIY